MSCCGVTIQAHRNADLRITYKPGRKFSFADFTALMEVRDGSTVLLSISMAATVNGSVFSNADDALVLTIEKPDLAALAVNEDQRLLSYDIVISQGGFEDWFLGGDFVLLGLNDASCENNTNVGVEIGGQSVEVTISGGNIGPGASVLLADLNQAVEDAEQAAEDATVNGAIAGAAAGATAGEEAGESAGTTAGSAAGTAAANVVVAGKASITLDNINLPAAVASLRLADFATRTAAQAAFIPAPQAYIRTAGYTTAGDGGGALYTRAASGQLKTSDGQWWEIAQSSVTPEMFGAKGDGTTDDTAAINAAIAHPRARKVVLQDKNYKVTTVNVSRPIAICGLNKWFSKLVGSTTSATTLNIAAAPVEITNLTIDRSVVPVDGAVGITTLNGGFGKFSDLVIQNHFDGIFLRSTANAELSNTISQFNYRHGVRGEVTSTGAEPALQWKMTNVISQMNDGLGFQFYAFGSTNLQTGFVGINCGTFRNGQGGWRMGGDVGTAWNDINMYHCYSSFDNGDGIAWVRIGANNQMFDTFCEWNGMVPGGRGYDNIPARKTGCGVLFEDAASGDSSMIMSGVTVQDSSLDGLFVSDNCTLKTLQVTGGIFRDNGQAGVAYRKGGIATASTTTSIYLSNVVSKRQNYTTQEYGISAGSPTVAETVFAWGCDFRNNGAPSQQPPAKYGAWLAVPATF